MPMLQERVLEATAIITRELAGIPRGCLGGEIVALPSYMPAILRSLSGPRFGVVFHRAPTGLEFQVQLDVTCECGQN